MAKNSYPLSQVANELNNMVAEFLTEYSEELQAKADKVTEEVAKDFAEKLKTVTPRSDEGPVHMADTVIITTNREKIYGHPSKARFVSYEQWQLTHLLEFGWTHQSGKRIDRQPFARPLFDQNKERYYKMYKEELSKND